MRQIGPARFFPDALIVTELRDELIVPVVDRHYAPEIRNQQLAVTSLIEMAGSPHGLGIEADVLAIHRESLQARVGAVRHHQDRIAATSVHPDAVRAIELAGLTALAAPGSNTLQV